MPVEPKVTIAPLGVDVSWKVWSLVAAFLIVVFVITVTFFAIAAGVNVKVIRRSWFWNRLPAVEKAKPEIPNRPRIFRDGEESK